MSFYALFCEKLIPHHKSLVEEKTFQSLAQGNMTKSGYSRVLRETYHLVRHVPTFFSTAAARIDTQRDGLKNLFYSYAMAANQTSQIAISDLQHLGVDVQEIGAFSPLEGTASFIGYHFYLANLNRPISLLGAVVVSEGLEREFINGNSETIQKKLNLKYPPLNHFIWHKALPQLRDQPLKSIIDHYVKTQEDQFALMESAQFTYGFYRRIFEEIGKEIASLPSSSSNGGPDPSGDPSTKKMFAQFDDIHRRMEWLEQQVRSLSTLTQKPTSASIHHNFAIKLAHELNNPLTILLGFSEELSLVFKKNHGHFPEQEECLEKIKFAAHRIAELLKKLNQISDEPDDNKRFDLIAAFGDDHFLSKRP